MADDNIIEVAIRMQTDMLAASMQQSVDITRNATAQMSEAFNQVAATSTVDAQRVATSSALLGNGFAAAGAAATTATASASAGATLAKRSTDELTQSVKNAEIEFTMLGAVAQNAGAEVGFSMGQAKGSLALVGEEVGVVIPRHLRSFIAELPGVGAALSAAFEVFAVVALIEVLVKVTEKLTELISETYIYTEAQKEEYKQQVELNKEIGKQVDALQKLKLEYDLIGKSGKEATEIKFNRVTEHVRELQLQLMVANNTVYDFEKGLNEVNFVDYATAKHNIALLRAEIATAQQEQANLSHEYDTQAAEEGKRAAEERRRENERQLGLSQKAMETAARATIGVSSEVNKEIEKQDAQHAKSIDAMLKQQLDDELKANEAELKAMNARMAGQEAATQSAIQQTAQEYDYRAQRINQDAQLGLITDTERISRLKKNLDDEFQAQMQQAARLLTLYRNDPTKSPQEVERVLREIDRIQAKHRQDELALDTQQMMRRKQQLDIFFGSMSQGWSSTIKGMLTHQQSFTDGLKSMWNDILGSFIDMLVQMAMTWVEKHVFMMIFGKTMGQADIMTKAGQAFAAAYASTAAIPIVGPELAPAVAASAAMGVISGGTSFLAFERGGIVPNDTLAYVHKNEMVLPAHIAAGVQAMTMNSGGSSSMPLMVNLTATDAMSFKKQIKRVARDLGREVEKDLKMRGITR